MTCVSARPFSYLSAVVLIHALLNDHRDPIQHGEAARVVKGRDVAAVDVPLQSVLARPAVLEGPQTPVAQRQVGFRRKERHRDRHREVAVQVLHLLFGGRRVHVVDLDGERAEDEHLRNRVAASRQRGSQLAVAQRKDIQLVLRLLCGDPHAAFLLSSRPEGM